MTHQDATLKVVASNTSKTDGGSPSNIVMVASGKGGVGKTWFSITFAQSLAQMGRKVLLFDGDLGLANVDIQLGLTPQKDLGTVLSGQATLEDVISPYKAGGFDIIAGRSGCGSLASISKEKLLLLQAGLKKLARHYDVILMDMGAGVGQNVRTLSHTAGSCYVVVTDEPTSLTDAYAFLKVTHAAHQEMPLNIVVNQAETTQAGRRVYETLKKVSENFLRYTPNLGGIIRRDGHVKDAIRSQTPLLTCSIECPAAKDVLAIARSYQRLYNEARVGPQ